MAPTNTPDLPRPTKVPGTPCPPEQRQPVDVMLVLDRSGSMDDQQIADARQAARQLVGQLDLGQDQVGLVSFASKASLDARLGHDESAMGRALDRLRASGGTNIAAGIDMARAELTGNRHSSSATKAIVLMSDGQAKDKDAEARQAARQAKADGIRIITIALGPDADRELLLEIASSARDAYYQPTSSDLVGTFLDIASTVHKCSAVPLPTATPIAVPTNTPTETAAPSTSTATPTGTTTSPSPTEGPSATPTEGPSPTPAPTEPPAEGPSPTPAPTEPPAEGPSPTPAPTEMPTEVPSPPSTEAPTATPVDADLPKT